MSSNDYQDSTEPNKHTWLAAKHAADRTANRLGIERTTDPDVSVYDSGIPMRHVNRLRAAICRDHVETRRARNVRPSYMHCFQQIFDEMD